MSTDDARYLVGAALDWIAYDTSVEAGDQRLLMKAAAADLRNGVRNANTDAGIRIALDILRVKPR